MTFQLRPHQIAACDAVEDAFRAGINRPLLDICVGGGKSLIYAELARREIERGGRAIIGSHTRELVEQNATACSTLGLRYGINAAALNERTWRAPVISAGIQSVHRHAQSFGPISLFCGDEAHLWPHSEAGMFRALHRGLGYPRLVGGSGTPYRLQGGSLVEGEGAPFDRVVYRYSIIDGIRDGYLVAPFCAPVDDQLDVSKLRVAQGEYTGNSQDAQMIAMMDNHIAQMLHYGRDRRSWLVFEASKKAAVAMAARMNEWGIPTGLILGDRSKAEAIHRRNTVEAFRAGRLRAVVNVECLTTGFDVQEVDLLVCRRRTKSLSLWVQIVGRLLRTIGGNIESSVRAGKADGLLLDFAGCVDEFGPLDFIRPKDTTSKLVSCEVCGKRNAAAAMKCWSCDEPMTKRCPACLEAIRKGLLDCPHCGHDMRVGGGEEAPKPQKLLERPSGAALIASYKTGTVREGGWLPVRRVWEADGATVVDGYPLTGPLAGRGHDARWIRVADGAVDAILVKNGASMNSVLQVTRDGVQLPVPMPSVAREGYGAA
jgi:DNA repair protein RadD